MAKNKRVLQFTFDEVRRMRKLHAEGHTYTSIAALIGCKRDEVSNVVLRRSYAWVSDEPPVEGSPAWEREQEYIAYGHSPASPEHEKRIIEHIKAHDGKKAKRTYGVGRDAHRHIEPDKIRVIRMAYDRFVDNAAAGRPASDGGGRSINELAAMLQVSYATVSNIVTWSTYRWVGRIKPEPGSERDKWENMKHAGVPRMGMTPNLSTEECIAIGDRLEQGESVNELSRDYGVAPDILPTFARSTKVEAEMDDALQVFMRNSMGTI